MKNIIARAFVRFMACILCCTLFSQSALAQFVPQNMANSPVREYFIGRDMGKQLVTVHMLNGVALPGVYHVPSDTNIAELLAYAGGATDRSDLSGIMVRRGTKGQYRITDLDLEKALRDPNELFRIQDQDIVQINQKFSLDRPVAYATILSAIASVVLTAIVLSRGSTNNN